MALILRNYKNFQWVEKKRFQFQVRNKKGNYIGFVPDTIRAFEKCGMKFYNEAILLNAIASASMRAENNMKNQKLTKVHQNVLIFKKEQ